MPAIKKPNLHFDTTLYTGTGSNGLAVTNGGFQPDLIWLKARDASYYNTLLDSVRGVSVRIFSDLTDSESNNGCQSSFNSNGFTLNADAGGVNNSTTTYVAWQWKGGNATVTNTDGTITSQVSANPTAGFSVVAWAGNSVNSATVGHGLGAVPAMIICKERNGGDYWHIKHKNMATTVNAFFQTDALYSAATVGDGVLGDLSSNTTFGFATAGSPGNVVAVNESGKNNIAYCWAQVAGYSAFGTYTGNGSTDGPFIYTGFRPKFLMVKRTDNTTNDWGIFDSAREPNNQMIKGLKPDSSGTEYSGYNYRDFLSNGFKWRNADSDINANGGTYIYAAFAESPFKFSNAK